MPPTSSLRSTACGSSRWRREKASSWSVSLAPRSAARAHVAEPLHRLAVDRRPCQSRLEELDVAEHDRQQVVEVVRHAGGELADRLQPLHLAQRGLDPLALCDLAEQLAVGGGEFGGAFVDARIRSSSFSRWHSYCRRRPRRAVCTMLTRVVGWNGRSRKVTLPSASHQPAAAGLRSRPPPCSVSSTKGRSDQGGCALTHCVSGAQSLLRTPPP